MVESFSTTVLQYGSINTTPSIKLVDELGFFIPFPLGKHAHKHEQYSSHETGWKETRGAKSAKMGIRKGEKKKRFQKTCAVWQIYRVVF